MAYIYYSGVFSYKHNIKALDWALKAYGDGNYDPKGEVANLLGKLYFGASGIKTDYKKAYNYFLKSSNNRNIDSYYYLGLCHLNGWGTKKDSINARKFLKAAADKGHVEATQKLKEL